MKDDRCEVEDEGEEGGGERGLSLFCRSVTITSHGDSALASSPRLTVEDLIDSADGKLHVLSGS